MRQIQITRPTPVLNTPDFSFAFGGKSGSEIPLNERGLPFCFEWVALPGMVFEIEKIISSSKSHSIYQVRTPHYPLSPLYIDSRFTEEKRSDSPPTHTLSKEEIIEQMKALAGTPYVWGGNWSGGIPEMLTFYPPKGEIDEKTKTLWTLQGVDCSGLLFQILQGSSPRNTSDLVHWGKKVPFERLSKEELFFQLEPLDMLIYPGHILFVIDSHQIIESRYPIGVIQSDLREKLDELFQNRNLVDVWKPELDPRKNFIIRRFPF